MKYSIKFIAQFLTLTMLLSFLGACGGSDGGSGSTLGLKIRLASQSKPALSPFFAQRWDRLLLGQKDVDIFSTGDYGSSASGDITSLKYFVFGISVCQGLTTTGTAYSSPTGCISLYDSGVHNGPGTGTWNYDSESMNYQAMATTAQTNASAMTDFMDATSRGTLSQSVALTSANVGAYNWAIVTWYPVALLKAQVTAGSTTLKTSGTGTVDSGTGAFTSSTSLSGGTLGESPVSTGNGGTWFHFQNPLSVTADDITNNVAYSVDLAFDPAGFIKGVLNTGGCGTCLVKDGGTNGITEPILDVTPIPHKSTDTVMRETWIATMTGATDGTFTIKLKLYYLKSDTSKTIYGVNVNTYLGSSTSSFVNNFPKVASITTNGDGSVNFMHWDGTTQLISNFDRVSAGTINCTSGAFTTDDCADGTSATPTWTLSATDELTGT